MKKKSRPKNPANPLIEELGLNPDLYDATGFPISRIDPESGALVAGDPEAFARGGDDVIQVIGDPRKMFSGAEPTLRRMRLDDLDDDCPVCQANRERILADDPPMVYAFD